MVAIALYQSDIPQNVGSILRLCACMDVACHIIEPCGFVVDDKRIRRAGMDYMEHVRWQRHASWKQFTSSIPSRLVLLSTKAKTDYYDFSFQDSDILLLGRESAGVPQEIFDYCPASVRIPMAVHARSLNVALTASMVLGEALRQTAQLPVAAEPVF